MSPAARSLAADFAAGLCLLPLVTAELVELDDRVLAAANVFGDEIKLRRRDIQRVRALIGDLDIVLDNAVDADLLHADIAADAVVLMHDEVARRKVRKRAELLPVGRFLMLFARFLSGLRQQLALPSGWQSADRGIPCRTEARRPSAGSVPAREALPAGRRGRRKDASPAAAGRGSHRGGGCRTARGRHSHFSDRTRGPRLPHPDCRRRTAGCLAVTFTSSDGCRLCG